MVPAGSAGLVATICASVWLVMAPRMPPNETDVAVSKWLPVIVTEVPPASGPASAAIPVTMGAARYVNWSAGVTAEAPPAARSVTSTGPAEPSGLTAVICVPLSLSTGTWAVPKSTMVTPPRLTPVMVTVVPPARGPTAGVTAVTTGCGPVSVKVRT